MKFIKYTCLLLISYPLFSQQSFPENGVKSTFSPIYAFTNANIVISPEKQIHNGTLLIKEDKIIISRKLDLKNEVTYDNKENVEFQKDRHLLCEKFHHFAQLFAQYPYP